VSASWTVDDEYMLGPSLLVAPLFTGQAKRKVYLPRGDRYDFWTGERQEGSRAIEVSQPVDRIPVFVKGGTLLPIAKPVERVGPETVFEVTVRAYGPRPAPFALQDDDGVTFDFERGARSRVELRWDGRAGSVARSGGYTGPSRYRIVGWEAIGAER